MDARGGGCQCGAVLTDNQRGGKERDALFDREVCYRFFFIRGTIIGDFPEIFEPERKGPPYKERGSASLGDFEALIRQVAAGDADRLRLVMAWPLRDIMLAYVECMKAAAQRGYEIEMLVWSSLAPHQRKKTDPPAIPRILRS